MTRQLIVIRHAHAGHDPGLPDHERPLSARGRAQAEHLGVLLQPFASGPLHVAVSSAVRAHQTWALLSRGLGAEQTAWITDPRLYRAVADDLAALLDVIHATPADADTLALVGHDPGFTTLIHVLTEGAGASDAWAEMHPHLRKASAAILTVSGEWSSCEHGSATLEMVVRSTSADA